MPLYEGIGLASDKHSVVIEIGQAYTKCGFVHEYSPRAIIKSEVYFSKDKKVLNLYDITNEEDIYLNLKEFIQLLYFRYLAVNPKDRRVIIVESVFCPSKFRNKLVEVLFMHFDVPALLLVPQHLVALTTLGISSGLVLDVGYKESIAVPVVEGVTIIDALQYAPLGSKAIHFRIMDELIQRQSIIRQNGQESVIKDAFEKDLLEDIKVRTCFVAPFEKGIELAKEKTKTSIDVDIKSGLGTPCDVNYPIDGTKTLVVPGALRESVCEVMFEMYGDEHTVPTLIIEAILQSPRDVRKLLASNIVIIGGTSMLPGFKHRIMKELKSLATSNRFKSSMHFDEFAFHNLTTCKENYAAWLGASIFGSTEVLATRALTKEQYIKNEKSIQDWSSWTPCG